MMDRAGLGGENWSNPELLHVDYGTHITAVEPEPFDASTVDPSHIIYLIRQLLQGGTRADSARSEPRPGGSGVESLLSASNAVGDVSASQNGIIKESLKVVDGGTVYKNETTQVWQGVGRPSTKFERGIEDNRINTSCARVSASTDSAAADLKCKERSSAITLVRENGKYIEENGNHVEANGHSQENGDLSRKRGRECCKQNGCPPDHVENNFKGTPERISECTLVSPGTGKEGGNIDEGAPLASEAHQKTGEEDDAREEAGCVLWDLAATESHAEFLVKHHILDVLLGFLCVPNSDRMREICLGVFGNLACHPGPAKAMVAKEGLVETIVQQLFVDNTPSLTETCRLLSAGLHSEATATWVESIKPDHVLERIMWMAANTLNPQLLEKCTELILAMVDSRRDAAVVLLPSLLRLGLPGLLTDLIACELTAINGGTCTRGDLVLDLVLQIAEAISIPDDSASQLAASDKIFSLSCQVIRFSIRDEIGPSAITATVLIANLLTEEAGLIQSVLQDPIFLGRLLALVPCAGDDPGARNAFWSILGRICRWLVSANLQDPENGTSGMIAVLADGCSLLLDDLDIHLEDDVEEDKDSELAGHDAAASTSRGLKAKLATVYKMLCTMEQWVTTHSGSSVQDMPLYRSVRNASMILKKHIATSGISLDLTGGDSSGPVDIGGSIQPASITES